MSSMTIFGTT